MVPLPELGATVLMLVHPTGPFTLLLKNITYLLLPDSVPAWSESRHLRRELILWNICHALLGLGSELYNLQLYSSPALGAYTQGKLGR